MISEFDNCIFIHIPKVAGQSIESVFLERAGLGWQQREKMLLRSNSNPLLGPPRLAHLFAEEYINLGYVEKLAFEKMFKFSFVRNPWQRLVSEYIYRNYPCSFKEFIFKYFPTASSDDYSKGFDGYRHIIPQYRFLYDKDGNLLVDFIGKFENLAADFAKVSQLITGEILKLPHRNKSSSGILSFKKFNTKKSKVNYQDYYDEETKDFVANLYKKDIELFNYHF